MEYNILQFPVELNIHIDKYSVLQIEIMFEYMNNLFVQFYISFFTNDIDLYIEGIRYHSHIQID